MISLSSDGKDPVLSLKSSCKNDSTALAVIHIKPRKASNVPRMAVVTTKTILNIVILSPRTFDTVHVCDTKNIEKTSARKAKIGEKKRYGQDELLKLAKRISKG
ncbi:hypothetical protein PM082_009951 [Marasmius tenuissimus]|nr:hypothetical protein PM082_009951 [Marasmius tenuissimus]